MVMKGRAWYGWKRGKEASRIEMGDRVGGAKMLEVG